MNKTEFAFEKFLPAEVNATQKQSERTTPIGTYSSISCPLAKTTSLVSWDKIMPIWDKENPSLNPVVVKNVFGNICNDDDCEDEESAPQSIVDAGQCQNCGDPYVFRILALPCEGCGMMSDF